MPLIDLHADTISCLLAREEKGLKADLFANDLAVDIRKLQKSAYILQCFAAFTDLKANPAGERHTLALIDAYYRYLEANEAYIGPVYQYADILNNQRQGKISALLTLEEGDVCFHDLAMLRNYYRLGVRMSTLTWNYNNSLATAAVGKTLTRQEKLTDEAGLTAFGLAYVKEAERLGIIIDAAHLSDAGFWDLIKYTQKPFLVSHSDARGLVAHPRNLSDAMILALKDKGGIIGINFYARFLNNKDNVSRIKDIVKHILYIRKLAGSDILALGTDFDGFDSQKEIEDAGKLSLLADALRESGLSKEEVEKIFYRNALHFLRKLL